MRIEDRQWVVQTHIHTGKFGPAISYQIKYKKTLAKAVKDDCSGDYARILLKIIGH